jgi:hypothetical protein
MDIEELKTLIRHALQSAAEDRSGYCAQSGGYLPDYLKDPENLGAAELLFDLADDVERIDIDVMQSLMDVVSRDPDPAAMFKDGRFAFAASEVGEPINLPWDPKPWLPQTATEFLRSVLNHPAWIYEPREAQFAEENAD